VDPRRVNAHRSTHFAALILALALVPIAFAAKGGNGGKSNNGNNTSTSTLTLQLVVDANNNGQPSWGDTVTFVVSNPPADPNVELVCSQNGTVVYAARTGYYENTWPSTADMVLRSQAWSSGSADCTARLYVIDGLSTATLAKLSFTATGA
jgi:hypothetical protein